MVPFHGFLQNFPYICIMDPIVLDQLTIGYTGRRHTPHVVASDLQATLPAGRLTCLIGANGVGKSTLLRTLAGFQPPLAGQVFLQGRPARTLSSHDYARQVAVVLTRRPEVYHLSVAELVGLGRTPYTGFWGTLSAADRSVVARALSLAGIASLASRSVGTLSDGECQKLMIAKALAQQTPVILLDEPTAFLDFPSKVETLHMLRCLAHDMGKAILLSTHDVQLALQAADGLWLLQLGGSLAVGTPRNLADAGVLGRFLHGEGVSFHADTLTLQMG